VVQRALFAGPQVHVGMFSVDPAIQKDNDSVVFKGAFSFTFSLLSFIIGIAHGLRNRHVDQAYSQRSSVLLLKRDCRDCRFVLGMNHLSVLTVCSGIDGVVA
jgi:hypothetical protein